MAQPPRRPQDPSSAQQARPFSFQLDAQHDDAFTATSHSTAESNQQQQQHRPLSLAYTPIEDNTQDSVQLNNLVAQSQATYGSDQQGSNGTASTPQQPQQNAQPVQQAGQAGQRSRTNSEQIQQHPQTPQQQPQAQYPVEKTPERMPAAYQARPPEEPHPAVFAPYAENSPIAERGQHPQQAQSQQLQQQNQEQKVGQGYAGATPMETENGRADTRKSPAFSPDLVGTPTKPGFNPNAFSGPNGIDLSTAHQPGQIAHPNMHYAPPPGMGARKQTATLGDRSWSTSLFQCPDTSLCCLGLFCPCVLYSRTSYRLAQRSRRADATDLLGFENVNGNCMLFTVACGLQGILTGILSARVRHAYEIEGGVVDDFCTGCCCAPCSLIRDEHEVTTREERRRLFAGPANASTAIGAGISSPQPAAAPANGYPRVQPMAYQPHSERGSY